MLGLSWHVSPLNFSICTALFAPTPTKRVGIPIRSLFSPRCANRRVQGLFMLRQTATETDCSCISSSSSFMATTSGKAKLSYKLIKHSKLPRPCCKECKTDEHESCRKCLIFAIMKIVRRTIFISSSSCAQKSWKKFSYLSLSPRTLIFVLPRRDVRFL